MSFELPANNSNIKTYKVVLFSYGDWTQERPYFARRAQITSRTYTDLQEANQAGRELANGVCNYIRWEEVTQVAGRTLHETECRGKQEAVFHITRDKVTSKRKPKYDLVARVEVMVVE